MVEPTHLKDISQIGSFPQVRVKMKNIGNHHHPVFLLGISSTTCQVPSHLQRIFQPVHHDFSIGDQHQEHSLEDSYAVVFGTKGAEGSATCHISSNFSPIFQSIYLSMVWFCFDFKVEWLPSRIFWPLTVPSGKHGRLENPPLFNSREYIFKPGPFSIAMLVYPGVSYMKVIWAQMPFIGVK